MACLLRWIRLDDDAPPEGEVGRGAGVVVLGPGQAPGDWVEARARWPVAWLAAEGPGAGGPGAGAASVERSGVERSGVERSGVERSGVEAALASAPLPVLLVDADGQLAWANAATLRLLGASSLAALTHGAGLVAPAAAGVAGPDQGNRARRADGGTLAVQVQAWWIQDQGRPMLALALRDASDERRARDELARGALYHRALVANALDSITIVDADGIVLYQSPASRTLLGLAPEEVVGAPLRLAFAEDRLRARRVLTEVGAAPGRSGRLLYRTFDAEGRLHWMEGLISNHLDNPLVGGLVLNSRDVTEKRSLERGLREAERLRVAGLLGATVAHDMNNMIAVVLDGLDALEDCAAHEPRAGARLAVMREALGRSSELARRLMAIGGRGGGEAERVDLGRVVRGLSGLLETVLRRGQTLQVEVAAGEHPVRLPVSDLEQVIVNLVVNARDALGAQGKVVVRVERRPGGPFPRVALIVQDDGAGMDEQTRARIFEPFFTTKGPGQGSGLGMVVVETFVHEAGGEVEVRSAPGQGTAVELVLPIAVPAEDPAAGGS